MGPPRVVLLGSKKAGLDVFKTIARSLTAVVTLDDRKDPRSVYPEFVSTAEQNKIPFKVATRADSEQVLRELAPDLCIVCGWYWILGPRILNRIPRGVVGVHHSMLPRYRGGAPVVWALMNDESRIGTTLFHFGEGIDDGDIIDQRATDVLESDYVSDVLERLERLDVDMVARNFDALLQGTAKRTPQDPANATFFGQRNEDDGRIDWTWSARRVRNFIRAQAEPYPGAWTLVDGARLTVWRAELFPGPCVGRPGQVAQVVPGGVHICCGGGTAVTVTQVQQGARRSAAPELLQSGAFVGGQRI